MASKSNLKTKGLGADPSLGKMGQRMISAMLREERIAERDLQEKLKAISQKEHKAMVKLGCDSLDIRHDLTLHRSSSPLSWREHKDNLVTGEFEDVKKGRESQSDLDDNLSRPRLGRRAVSMLTYPTQDNTIQATEFKRTNSEQAKSHFKTIPNSPTILIEKHGDCMFQGKEDKNNLGDLNSDQTKTSSQENLSDNCKTKTNCSSKVGLSSPRLLRRRPVSDISSNTVEVFYETEEEVFVEQISLGKGVCSNMQLRPTPPSTPPPQRRHLNSLSPDGTKPRPSSARSARSRTPVSQTSTVREIESLKLDRRNRSPSPSPSTHLSPELSKMSLGRRGSAPPKIDAGVLLATTPLRKALGSNDVTQGLRPATPDALRARLSSNEEELKDRVSVFLKSLQKK